MAQAGLAEIEAKIAGCIAEPLGVETPHAVLAECIKTEFSVLQRLVAGHARDWQGVDVVLADALERTVKSLGDAAQRARELALGTPPTRTWGRALRVAGRAVADP